MITLEDVLIAKEKRVARRELFQSDQALPVLTFSLNIPGNVKDSYRIRKLFQAGIQEIEQRFSIEKSQCFYEKTGLYGFFLIQEEPLQLKEICSKIENEGSFKRLWDLDVNDSSGRAVTLTERSQGRKCFLCDQLSSQCMREQRHSLNEILNQVENLFDDFFAQESRKISLEAERYGAFACEAALFEAASFPSPGLVDPLDSGSHSDMDYFTFLSSTAALSTGFARCAEAGLQHQGDVKKLLPILRRIGMEAEREMFTATAGVNTQKGLLFSLGLVLGATGFLFQKSKLVSVDEIQSVVCEMTEGLVAAELERLNSKEQLTAGEMIYQKFSLAGIRGEVEAGFPSVFQAGLPALEQSLEKGFDLHQSLMITLVSLMAVVEDTTILWRSPKLETLQWIREKAQQILTSKVLESSDWQEAIRHLNEEFVGQNISPGGSADLVAVTWYFYKIKNNLKK